MIDDGFLNKALATLWAVVLWEYDGRGSRRTRSLLGLGSWRPSRVAFELVRMGDLPWYLGGCFPFIGLRRTRAAHIFRVMVLWEEMRRCEGGTFVAERHGIPTVGFRRSCRVYVVGDAVSLPVGGVVQRVGSVRRGQMNVHGHSRRRGRKNRVPGVPS